MSACSEATRCLGPVQKNVTRLKVGRRGAREPRKVPIAIPFWEKGTKTAAATRRNKKSSKAVALFMFTRSMADQGSSSEDYTLIGAFVVHLPSAARIIDDFTLRSTPSLGSNATAQTR